jgi:hypothetical protein
MSHHTPNAKQINGTLVSVVIIVNFLVIGGLILAASPEASARLEQVVAINQPS